MKLVCESTIIVCGIVKNAARGLKRNIPQIEALCKMFKDYRVFVYENDSTDETKSLLDNWHKKAPHHVVVSLNTTQAKRESFTHKEVSGVNPFYSRERIEKMARLRNTYMSFIDGEGWRADYLIVVDLDVAWIDAINILTSFEKDGWDAVTAFGYSLSPKFKRRYHDTYALTELGDEHNPQTEHKTKVLSEKFATMLRRDDNWIPVFSAFGGLAIYRFESVRGLRYRVLENDDNRVEVKCEHFSLYKQMAERGYDKVFINPKMMLKYQDLTIGIVWRSFFRMLRNLMGGDNLEYFPCVALVVETNLKCPA